jgi:hypothetical protein
MIYRSTYATLTFRAFRRISYQDEVNFRARAEWSGAQY